MKYNFLVTGSDGFIGTNLCSFLRKRGHDVEGWDIKLGKDAWNLTVDDTKDKIVIHLAGKSGVREGGSFTENWSLTKRVASVSDKIMLASSSNAQFPTVNNYAMSKKKSEQLIGQYGISMRFSTVYGPHARDNMLYGLIRDKKLEWVSDHIRDFIHVDDVCEAVELMAVKYDQFKGKTVDVSTGKGVVVSQLCNMLDLDFWAKPHPKNEVHNNVEIPKLLMKHGWQPRRDVFTEFFQII